MLLDHRRGSIPQHSGRRQSVRSPLPYIAHNGGGHREHLWLADIYLLCCYLTHGSAYTVVKKEP